ncbi:unnamed protein product [Ceutorhynchus assimilis]|uniref:Coilin n=1 Tax=Ceutorhynchus assimilis TaxID=467358 RepID=A0A9P0GQ23_9CUCU|nr:unnamed protein product [Ceutorhynchus assimilis]
MAGSKGFRVILDLSRCFQDHRKTARVFIKEDFKTIQDLQVHISNVFGIQDYYLTSGEHYLPLLEDIGVLSNGETICVIPKQENTALLDSSNLCSNGIAEKKACKIPQQNITFRKVHEKSKADTVRLSRHADTPLISYNKYRPPRMITGQYLKKKSNNIIQIDVLRNDKSIEPSNVSENEQNEDSSENYARMENLTRIPEERNHSFSDNDISINAMPNDKIQTSLEKNDFSNENGIDGKDDTFKMTISEFATGDIELDVSSNKSPLLNEMSSFNVSIENKKTFPLCASSQFVTERKQIRIQEESTYSFSNDDVSIKGMPNEKVQKSLGENNFLNNDIDKKEYTSKMTISKSSTDDIGLDVSSNMVPLSSESSSLNLCIENEKTIPLCTSSSLATIGKLIRIPGESNYSFSNMPNDEKQESLGKNDLSNIDCCKKEDTSKTTFSNFAKKEIASNESSDIALTWDNSSVLSNLSTENDNNFTSDTSVPVVKKRKRIRIRKRKKPKTSVLDSKEEAPFNSLFKTKSTPDRSCSIVHIRFGADKIDSEKMEVNEDASSAPVDSEILNDEDTIVDKWKRHISDAPLLNTIPKSGDIITFKILKIGENYTPQITNNIIGKVETCESETGELSVNILGGLEELSPPSSGKFGLDCEENRKSTTRSFLFTQLISPRLLNL